MAIRTEYSSVLEHEIIVMAKVGRYDVIVYPYLGTICYQLQLNGMKVRCWTRAEERAFPRKPAWRGHELVNIIKAQRRITE